MTIRPPELHSGVEYHSESPVITQKVDIYGYGALMCKISFSSGHDSLQGGVDPPMYQLAENCTKLAPQDRPTMNEILSQIDGTLNLISQGIKSDSYTHTILMRYFVYPILINIA